MPIADALTPFILAVMVAIATQIIKNFIELKITPDNSIHDSVIRLVSIALGIVAWGMFSGMPESSQAILLLLYNGGLLIGGGAVLGYHGATQVIPAFLGKQTVDKTSGTAATVEAPTKPGDLVQSVDVAMKLVDIPVTVSMKVPESYTPKVDPSLSNPPLNAAAPTFPANTTTTVTIPSPEPPPQIPITSFLKQ